MHCVWNSGADKALREDEESRGGIEMVWLERGRLKQLRTEAASPNLQTGTVTRHSTVRQGCLT